METVLLKIPDVMERLSLGQTKVYALLSSGELRSVKVGRPAVCPVTSLSASWPSSTTADPTSASRAEALHSPRFLAPCPQASGQLAADGGTREVTLGSVSIRAPSCA